MRNNLPGYAMMGSALMLLAALTTIAWQQDAAREQLLSKAAKWGVCPRLATELKLQVDTGMRSSKDALNALRKCQHLFEEIHETQPDQ